MRSLLREESGQSIVELIIAMTFMLILMAALSNVFTSGLRAGTDATARVGSQSAVRAAVDRLEWEARCAASATILSSGAGVTLTMPSQCPHVTGSDSWCVVGSTLTRYTTTDCTGTGVVLAQNITSPTPFCLQTTTGELPELHVTMSANAAADGSASDAQSASSTIVLRNESAAGSTSAACP